MDHDIGIEEWIRPSVTADFPAVCTIADDRNHPMYLRGAQHAPPHVEAIADNVAALFESPNTKNPRRFA